jgi:hypothetical protein
MPVIIVGEEKDFAALRQRLFTGSVSTRAAGRVASALAAANPGVDLDALQPGTVLQVPDHLTEVALPADFALDGLSVQALDDVVAAMDESLVWMIETGHAAEEVAAKDRDRLREALASDEVLKAVSGNEVLQKLLEGARSDLEQAPGEATVRQQAFEEARAEWAESLQALRGLVASG